VIFKKRKKKKKKKKAPKTEGLMVIH